MVPIMCPAMVPIMCPAVVPIMCPAMVPIMCPAVVPIMCPAMVPIMCPAVVPIMSPAMVPGTMCDEDVDECVSNPCQNQGTCIDQLGGYICDCDVNFSGEHCELERPKASA